MERLTLERWLGKRSGDAKIEKQIDYILRRGLNSSRGRGWVAYKNRHTPRRDGAGWYFRCDLTFEKKEGRGRGTDTEYRQWEDIKAMIIQTGQAAVFGEHPWRVSLADQNKSSAPADDDKGVLPDPNAPSLGSVLGDVNQSVVSKLGGVREVSTIFSVVKTWKDLVVPPELLGRDSNQYLAQHPAWMDLYGLGAQTRLILSNIRRAHETDGLSRNHLVLYGHASCGKSTTLLNLERMFGPGSALRLDATSTTRAGIEKLFFNDLPVIPPLVFMEEAEKADPEALKVWLGALDDRGEIRKVNFRVNQLREVKVLFLCTVNNKAAFDKLMGSDGSQAGALSSRCVTQLYYPRPSENVLRQILHKEINHHGGNPLWIDPAIRLAQELDITDPRQVRAFLSGGDRLLTGDYQNDWREMAQAAKVFNHRG